MTDSKEAWAEVDRRFSEFGRIVAERHRKAGEQQATPPPEQARKSLEEAFSVVTRPGGEGDAEARRQGRGERPRVDGVRRRRGDPQAATLTDPG
jgi:hypothetical protein